MSAIRSVSQIGVREKYLIAFRDYQPPLVSVDFNDDSAFTLTSRVESVATVAAVLGAGYSSYTSLSAGDLFRDMGRSIMVVDDNGTHLALYREAQLVRGASTEGVDVEGSSPESYRANIYLRIWAADGNNVAVARLG